MFVGVCKKGRSILKSNLADSLYLPFFLLRLLQTIDIAGFTKWSAARSPVEVFQYLEYIYGEFDEIAKRRGVFKVETIGDCYLAGKTRFGYLHSLGGFNDLFLTTDVRLSNSLQSLVYRIHKDTMLQSWPGLQRNVRSR